MQLSVPSGWFCEGHCIWGDLGSGGVISRSYELSLPDLSSSDDQAHKDLEADLRLMLGCLKPGEKCQVSYHTASDDFSTPLDGYEQKTSHSNIDICTSVRSELVDRYRARIREETLIQGNVTLSLSSKLPKFEKENGRRIKGFADVFKIHSRSFDQRAQFFNLLFSSYGGGCLAFDNDKHYDQILRFWSPNQSRQQRFTDLDWLRPIDDLCRFSGVAPRTDPDHGFYMDGYFFGLLVAKTLPRSTFARTMDAFMSLAVPNIRVVLNLEPLSIETELLYEEERFNKLWTNTIVDTNSKDAPSLQSINGIEAHKLRHALLLSNKVIPFKAKLIAIACEKTADKLDDKMEALRAALGKTGCEAFQPSLATSTLSFFNCATPGYGPWVPYQDFNHKVNDAVNAVNLIPAGSTPKADLDEADWITDGDQNNLIGGKCFTGDQADHMLVAGMTGAGKSSQCQSIALQTAPIFGFMVVIDDGLSWMTTCRKLDSTCKPIIVRSNGDLTFNIFDTRSQHLSPEHLSNATALCHLLVGQHRDQDLDKLRHAILFDTISEIYGVAFRKWRKNNPEKYYQLCEDNGIVFGDASETEAQNIACASWEPKEFPTLSDLQDELHSASLQKGPHQTICAALATLLRPWLRDGNYGALMDGVGNVDLGSVDIKSGDPLKVIHFELGEISKAQSELRAIAGFLITNEIRNHIKGMDRGIRKQVIVEEMVSFLRVPDAENIIVEYWQTMRKFMTQMVAVFQDYSTLIEVSPKVAKALIGNSSSMLLLRNQSTQDLKTLSSYMPQPIPDVIQDQIRRFPRPADLKKDERYAGFVYVKLTGDKPQYCVGRNYVSDLVERITSSSGSEFERKRQELNNEITNSNDGDNWSPFSQLLNATTHK